MKVDYVYFVYYYVYYVYFAVMEHNIISLAL